METAGRLARGGRRGTARRQSQRDESPGHTGGRIHRDRLGPTTGSVRGGDALKAGTSRRSGVFPIAAKPGRPRLPSEVRLGGRSPPGGAGRRIREGGGTGGSAGGRIRDGDGAIAGRIPRQPLSTRRDPGPSSACLGTLGRLEALDARPPEAGAPERVGLTPRNPRAVVGPMDRPGLPRLRVHQGMESAEASGPRATEGRLRGGDDGGRHPEVEAGEIGRPHRYGGITHGEALASAAGAGENSDDAATLGRRVGRPFLEIGPIRPSGRTAPRKGSAARSRQDSLATFPVRAYSIGGQFSGRSVRTAPLNLRRPRSDTPVNSEDWRTDQRFNRTSRVVRLLRSTAQARFDQGLRCRRGAYRVRDRGRP